MLYIVVHENNEANINSTVGMHGHDGLAGQRPDRVMSLTL